MRGKKEKDVFLKIVYKAKEKILDLLDKKELDGKETKELQKARQKLKSYTIKIYPNESIVDALNRNLKNELTK